VEISRGRQGPTLASSDEEERINVQLKELNRQNKAAYGL
jgi:hypothetical protein